MRKRRKIGLLIVFMSTVVLIGCGLFLFPYLRSAFLFLGFDRPKEYLVLFQNNMEIRPSGGFMGSFSRIRFEKGKLTLLKIEDIYVPDGQLDGHVDPPWPIQAAFGQGWYKLRDSNWELDFPTAAKTIEWFFEHGKEPKADGLITVNLFLLQDLLKITGPVYVTDEPDKISYDNFYKKTQSAVETGFFPGSIQKQSFLSKLGKSVLSEIEHLPLTKKIEVLKSAWRLVKEKQIYVSSHDPTIQHMVHQIHADGELHDIRTSPHDYFSFFETNLGANKANCCIERSVKLSLQSKNNLLEHRMILSYTNTNPSTLKQPPQYWGGAYVNFLRVVIPLDANVTSITVGEKNLPIPLGSGNDSKYNVEDLMKTQTDEEARKFITNDDTAHQRVSLEKFPDKGLQSIGFFVFVDALESKDVTVEYHTQTFSTLFIQKQGGIEKIPYTISVQGKASDVSIRTDQIIHL
jgi:hypothetical protein